MDDGNLKHVKSHDGWFAFAAVAIFLDVCFAFRKWDLLMTFRNDQFVVLIQIYVTAVNG
jgi:hypothetical protein